MIVLAARACQELLDSRMIVLQQACHSLEMIEIAFLFNLSCQIR
jgi:hypothetical protein